MIGPAHKPVGRDRHRRVFWTLVLLVFLAGVGAGSRLRPGGDPRVWAILDRIRPLSTLEKWLVKKRWIDNRRFIGYRSTCDLTLPEDFAALRLSEMGSPAVGTLILALSDREPLVRRAAVTALGLIRDPRATGPLIERLRDPGEEIEVRGRAACALGCVRPVTGEALSVLRRTLCDGDARLRADAAWGLGEMGPMAESAARDLANALQDESRDVRASAAFALQSMGPAAAAVAGELVAALGDECYYVRIQAARALGNIHAVVAGIDQHLIQALGDSVPCVRREALETLGKVYPPSRLRPYVLAALADVDSDVRRNAVEALAKTGPAARSAIPQLTALTKDVDEEVCVAAMKTLTQICSTQELVPILIQALDNEDGYVQLAAAKALGQIGPPAGTAIPKLMEISRRGTDGRTPRGKNGRGRRHSRAILDAIEKIRHPEAGH